MICFFCTVLVNLWKVSVMSQEGLDQKWTWNDGSRLETNPDCLLDPRQTHCSLHPLFCMRVVIVRLCKICVILKWILYSTTTCLTSTFPGKPCI